MNSAIELHDSECLAIEAGNDCKGSVLLDAYVHRSEGRPGWEEGEGGIQRVRVVFENITIDGMVGSLPAYIYEGSLEIGDVVFDNLIELPASYAGAVRLKVMLSEDARILVVSGTAATILAESEFRCVGPFTPASTLPSSN
jgi:hypothetical protein